MAHPARNLAPYKGKLIQLIHIAKGKLGLDDAEYRAILERKTGKTSSKGMSMSELEAVMEHMRTIGFEDRSSGRPASKAQAVKLADDPQSKLIRHYWLKLRDMAGGVRNGSELALAAYVKRQTGVERLEWLTTHQAAKVIEALKRWVKRLEMEGAP
jgi:phage gp16-like protein